MRFISTLCACLALAACTQPTDGVDETQAEERSAVDATVTPEEMAAADKPLADAEAAPDAIQSDIAASEAAPTEETQ